MEKETKEETRVGSYEERLKEYIEYVKTLSLRERYESSAGAIALYDNHGRGAIDAGFAMLGWDIRSIEEKDIVRLATLAKGYISMFDIEGRPDIRANAKKENIKKYLRYMSR